MPLVLALHTDAQSAIWYGPSGDALALVKTPSGGHLTSVETVAFTQGGRLAAAATDSEHPEDRGIWSGTPQEMHLIARVNEPLRAAETLKLETVESLQLNDNGQLIVSEKNESERLLVRYSPAAGFELVARSQGIIPTEDTEHVVSGYGQSSFVDDGRIVFEAFYSVLVHGLVMTDPLPLGGADVPLETPANITGTGGGNCDDEDNEETLAGAGRGDETSAQVSASGSGCGCRLAASRVSDRGSWALLLGACALVRRRRTSRPPTA